MIDKYKIFELTQLTSHKVVVTSINYKEIINKVKFSVRDNSKGDLFSNNTSETDEYYQRLLKEERTKEIAGFILSNIANKKKDISSSMGLFPSAIILAFSISDAESIKDFEKSINDTTEDPKGIYIDSDEIVIPNTNEGLIVDGQHRLAGFQLLHNLAKHNKIKIGRKSLNEAYPYINNEYILHELEQFSFPCTILLDFDRWEQGRVFANVNFKQKPVNRSLYYDIFGSFPDPDRNDIYLAHHYTVHLNNNLQSPLKGLIKLLGTGPGIFSQAFLVEALLVAFKQGHAFNYILLDFLNSGMLYRELPKFLRAYFNAIKITFSLFWPNTNDTSRSYKSVLLKTNGMGALIKLMEVIFKDLKTQGHDLKNTTEEEYQALLVKRYFDKIKSRGEVYFSSESDFAKSGSKGLQNALFLKIKSDLNL